MPRLTHGFILSGISDKGGWNRAQLAEIGVPWPPVTGWINRAVGREISPGAAEQFMALRGDAGRVRRRRRPTATSNTTSETATAPREAAD